MVEEKGWEEDEGWAPLSLLIDSLKALLYAEESRTVDWFYLHACLLHTYTYMHMYVMLSSYLELWVYSEMYDTNKEIKKKKEKRNSKRKKLDGYPREIILFHFVAPCTSVRSIYSYCIILCCIILFHRSRIYNSRVNLSSSQINNLFITLGNRFISLCTILDYIKEINVLLIIDI